MLRGSNERGVVLFFQASREVETRGRFGCRCWGECSQVLQRMALGLTSSLPVALMCSAGLEGEDDVARLAGVEDVKCFLGVLDGESVGRHLLKVYPPVCHQFHDSVVKLYVPDVDAG